MSDAFIFSAQACRYSSFLQFYSLGMIIIYAYVCGYSDFLRVMRCYMSDLMHIYVGIANFYNVTTSVCMALAVAGCAMCSNVCDVF